MGSGEYAPPSTSTGGRGILPRRGSGRGIGAVAHTLYRTDSPPHPPPRPSEPAPSSSLASWPTALHATAPSEAGEQARAPADGGPRIHPSIRGLRCARPAR
eukprot:scaffold1190_cov393-Prasinococcus_capsulatus_cf.AAC.11